MKNKYLRTSYRQSKKDERLCRVGGKIAVTLLYNTRFTISVRRTQRENYDLSNEVGEKSFNLFSRRSSSNITLSLINSR